MLYERWLQISSKFADRMALWDFSSGREWTFAQLAQEALQKNIPGSVAFPVGYNADFVLEVLAAWREGKLLCPLEAGQPKPLFGSLPKDAVHAKITSGSTGTPRSILFSAEQLEADARQIISTMGLRPEWPNVGAISLAHSYGFSNLITPLLLFGIPLILSPAPFPEMISAICKRAGDVTLPGVPALWKAWHEAGVIAPNIRVAISAGAPLPLQLERDVFEQTGIKIHNFYGASESGGIGYDRTDIPRHAPEQIGTAMDDVKLAVSEGGLLTIRSAAVGMSYYPEASDTLMKGAYQSCDMVELREGQILLKGRATDLINVAGRKVAPESIENALRGHPGIEHVVVFGIPSEASERGDEIVACIRTRIGKGNMADVRIFVSRILPGWQIPRVWWFEDSLQPNARGKISRAEWRNKYLQTKKG